MHARSQYRGLLALGFVTLLAVGACSTGAADLPAGPPATPAEAAKVLDLSTFPLMDGVDKLDSRRLANLSYVVKADVKAAFEFQRKQLLDAGWKELPGSSVTDQYASATFSRAGYTSGVMILPKGEKGVVAIGINNFGNVPLDKLPVPPDAKPVYVGPTSAMYVTESSVVDTVAACSKLLGEKGWEPYGKAGDSLVFKQNAIQLNAMISSAPAQGGKTMINYSAALMSVDLPAPAETINLHYADVTTELMFDTNQPSADVFSFYRKRLAKDGWEATLEKAIQIDNKDTVIFRNAPKDMLTLQLYPVEGINRVILKHQSAAEIAEIEAAIKEAAEKKKTEAEKKKAEANR